MDRWKPSARDDMSHYQEQGHILTGGVAIKHAANIHTQYF
jgi:hypothetical protein